MTERIRVEIDPDIEDLVPGFLSNRRKDITAIRQLVDTGGLDQIRILGHSMKGAGGGYGFDEITAIGARLENAALAADSAEIRAAVDALEDYLERIEVVPAPG